MCKCDCRSDKNFSVKSSVVELIKNTQITVACVWFLGNSPSDRELLSTFSNLFGMLAGELFENANVFYLTVILIFVCNCIADWVLNFAETGKTSRIK